MNKGQDVSLLLLDTISASVRLVEKMGDAIYADHGMSEDTKRTIDALIVQLNSVFTDAIKRMEGQRD